MRRRDFEDLVRQAVEELPDEFLERLDNVDVVVADRPSREQLRSSGLHGSETLFGLYEGVPLTDRQNYGLVVPDRITIFQRPLERMCASEAELIEQIRVTVIHEIAHHFGLDDQALRDLGVY